MSLEPDSPMYVEALQKHEVSAIQAVYHGEANESQQREAIDAILYKICRLRDLAYIPNDPNGSAFIAGRQYCGHNIVRSLKTNIGMIPDE